MVYTASGMHGLINGSVSLVSNKRCLFFYGAQLHIRAYGLANGAWALFRPSFATLARNGYKTTSSLTLFNSQIVPSKLVAHHSVLSLMLLVDAMTSWRWFLCLTPAAFQYLSWQSSPARHSTYFWNWIALLSPYLVKFNMLK